MGVPRMTPRLKSVLAISAFWVFGKIADKLFDFFYETASSSSNTDAAIAFLSNVLSFVSGPYGSGFIVGAIIFAIWDIPFFARLIRNYRQRKRDVHADGLLADECDEVSKYLYDEAALLERISMERHWELAQPDTDMHQSWLDARTSEAREEERIRRHIGHRIQALFIQLRKLGIEMELFHFSLRRHDLLPASNLFSELAISLRSGD